MSCWNLVTILSKLGCNLLKGRIQPTYIGVKHSIDPVPAGHPSTVTKTIIIAVPNWHISCVSLVAAMGTPVKALYKRVGPMILKVDFIMVSFLPLGFRDDIYRFHEWLIIFYGKLVGKYTYQSHG